MVAELDVSLTITVDKINSFLETPEGEAKDAGKMLAFYLKWVAQDAYRLHEWLRNQATAYSDQTDLLEQLQDSEEPNASAQDNP